MSVNSSDTVTLEVPPIDVLLRSEWEEWGLCPACGTQTHEVVVRRKGTIGDSKVRTPLTVPGTVHNGRCLGCDVWSPMFPDLLGADDSARSVPHVVAVPQDDDAFRKRLATTRETKKTKTKTKTQDGDSVGTSIDTSIDSASIPRSIDDSSASNTSTVDDSSSDEDSSDDDVSASSATYVTGNGSTKRGKKLRTQLPSVVSVDQPNSSSDTSRGIQIAHPATQELSRPLNFTKATALKREWTKPSRPVWTAKGAIRSHEQELQRMLGSSLFANTGDTVSVGSLGKSPSLLSSTSTDSESSSWVAESQKSASKLFWVPGKSVRNLFERMDGRRPAGPSRR